ncbi:MAG: hypothetical protein HQ581_01505 [Planctomycetes bacterium]|nr:hypothetical protein [Planctomycetota bacterium]
MSTRVMVICEDHRLDQYIIKPVVEHLFRDLDRRARIDVLSDPPIGGVSQALDKQTVGQILDENPMIDLFLLIVDRDGVESRENKLQARLQQASDSGKRMAGCLAIEEVEVWALALHREELTDDWRQVRAEPNPKETYFDPLVQRMGWQESLGKGRVAAMEALPGNWKSLVGRCPELQELQQDIAAWLKAS